MIEFSPLAFAFDQAPSPLLLAYLGDTVYDLYVRTKLVRAGGRLKDVHLRAVHTVCAHAQAAAFTRIEGMLTEEEAAVARRARNAKQSPPRNADGHEYHLATGFEALLGFLYVSGRSARLEEVIAAALAESAETEKTEGDTNGI